MTLQLVPLDCGHFSETERSAHQYLTGFGEKICPQSVLWVILGGQHPVVIDLPTSRPELVKERFGRTFVQTEEQQPRRALARLGIKPEEVRTVILTHLHWDHALGIEDDLFPNADILIQIEELRYAAAPYPPHAGLYDARILKKLIPPSACEYENVTLINGDFRLLPGLKVIHIPGHTPGTQGVIVTTAEGQTVMASDTVPFGASWRGRTLRHWVPQGIHVSLDDCYRSMSRVAVEADLVLPSHDPSVFGDGRSIEMAEHLPYGSQKKPRID